MTIPVVSPRRERTGEVPTLRLADARRVRDDLRASLSPRHSPKAMVTLVKGGFGVEIRHRLFGLEPISTFIDGVPVLVSPMPVARPRR